MKQLWHNELEELLIKDSDELKLAFEGKKPYSGDTRRKIVLWVEELIEEEFIMGQSILDYSIGKFIGQKIEEVQEAHDRRWGK